MRRVLAFAMILLLSGLGRASGTRIYYGPGKAQCLLPTADSSTSGWVLVGAASHFDAVNDTPDASCLGASTNDGATTQLTRGAGLTASDRFDLQDTSGLSGQTILYVTAGGVCQRDSGPTGAPAVSLSIVLSGTPYSFGNMACGNGIYSESAAMTKLYTNPATGVAWTASDIDSAQLSLDKTSAGTKGAFVTSIELIVAYEAPRNFGPPRERAGGGN